MPVTYTGFKPYGHYSGTQTVRTDSGGTEIQNTITPQASETPLKVNGLSVAVYNAQQLADGKSCRSYNVARCNTLAGNA